jgi:glycerol-3-phosphate O-acyltransferase / dihydroxyacetone phosphate acyltransferase
MAATASPIVRWLARVVSHLFYRIDRAGYVPASGAVLLLPNHPNSLLDPAIVWATAERDIRFLAKSTLFEGAFAPVLKGAGAIPVYRRLDQGVDPSRNVETFAAVDQALAAGQAVCIFPEGISHSAGRLAPLRSGAARMALGAERKGIAVQIVPVGLNFDRKTAFRSRVTVLYGRPFSVRDLVTDATDDPGAVHLVTDRIADAMRRLLVEADPETDAALVTRVERLYAAARGAPTGPEERVRRRQAIANAVERLRDADEARFTQLALRLKRYDQRLSRFRLRDRHLDWDISWRAALRFTAREGILAMALMPLALAGLTIFWVPYQITGLLARRATEVKDVAATAKVFVGAAAYAAWVLLIVAIVWILTGRRGAGLALVVLPLLAVAGLYAIEHVGTTVDTARAWLILRAARSESRARLKRERSELAALLEEIYEWLSAETPAPEAARKPN